MYPFKGDGAEPQGGQAPGPVALSLLLGGLWVCHPFALCVCAIGHQVAMLLLKPSL